MINGCGLNAYIAIEHDPALRDALAYYEMLRTVMLLHQIGTTLGDLNEPRPLTDKDVGDVQKWLQHAGLEHIGREAVHTAVDCYARDHSYHPGPSISRSAAVGRQRASKLGSCACARARSPSAGAWPISSPLCSSSPPGRPSKTELIRFAAAVSTGLQMFARWRPDWLAGVVGFELRNPSGSEICLSCRENSSRFGQKHVQRRFPM